MRQKGDAKYGAAKTKRTVRHKPKPEKRRRQTVGKGTMGSAGNN